MTHLTDDDLVLHYYGELADADERHAPAHLTECATCRREFTRLQRVLGAIDETALAVDLADGFERTVWARLEPNLRSERPRLVFVAGALARAARARRRRPGARRLRRSSPAGCRRRRQRTRPLRSRGDDQVRERILLVDLGEHLDRSQMILVELVSGG